MRMLVCAGLCLATLASPGTLAADPVPASSIGAIAADAALLLQPCRLDGLDHDALCGVLKRPLDPAAPAGTQFDLHVAVVPALARQKLGDPIFFFAGGPGQSAINLAGTVSGLLARLGTRRDLVLIDQRGTGHSAPLQCDTPSPADALARMLSRGKLVAAMDACRVELQRLPWGDLRFYTTSIAMADADAVRNALGAERVDLVGVSYGTRAALEYLRLYPQHVRRVVIDGVAPPDMALPESSDLDGRAAFDAMLRDCAAEPGCARAHPSLADTWQRLLASLPRHVQAHDPVTGQPLQLDLTPDAAADLVHPALYTPTLGALLPYAIEEAAAGRFDVLLTLGASQGGGGPTDLSEGQHFSVICSEDVPRMSVQVAESSSLPLPSRSPSASVSASVSALTSASTSQGLLRSALQGSSGLYHDVCAHWPRGQVPSAFYAIPTSPAPVLLLSGGLDPVTPPRHAARVARALGAQARAVVVAHSGHGVSALACMRDVVFHFVDESADADALKVEASCAAKVPRPLAFQPPRPSRAASAANDPSGFGVDVDADRSSKAPR